MKYAIFEDELFASQRLQLCMSKLRPNYELVKTGTAVAEAIDYFNGKPDIDIAFMDVELADANCFVLFERANVTVPLIFTTAYEEFALKAFKVNTVDYLLKPIDEAAVLLAINKFEKMAPATPVHLPDKQQRILILSGDNYTYANISDIAYVMSEGNYTYIYLTDGRHKLTNFKNLSEAEKALEGHDFFQLSRNIIASINSIRRVSKYFHGRLLVQIASGDDHREVTVSSSRKDEFLNWFGNGAR